MHLFYLGIIRKDCNSLMTWVLYIIEFFLDINEIATKIMPELYTFEEQKD